MKQYRYLALGAVLAFLCPLLAMNFAGCESSTNHSDDSAPTNTTFNITPQTVTLVASNTP
jgi:PBP1b-binding outer membrane lipoprotein LpoB